MSTRVSLKLVGGANLHVELVMEDGSMAVRSFLRDRRDMSEGQFLLACVGGSLVALPFTGFKRRYRFGAATHRSSLTEGRQLSEVSRGKNSLTEDRQSSDVSGETEGPLPVVSYPNWAHTNAGVSLRDLMGRAKKPGLYIVGAVNSIVTMVHIDEVALSADRASKVPDESGAYNKGTLEPVDRSTSAAG